MSLKNNVADLGKELFKNIWPNKTMTEVYTQLSYVFGNDEAHAKRLYKYFTNKWFLPSSPIIACVPFENEEFKGLPISCFLSETDLNGLYSIANETAYIAKHSGGLGTCWTSTPSIYANNNGGTIAQINVQGKIMKYCGGIARKVGSMCAWLKIDHADIEQFINMRINKGGADVDLQTPRYIHHGVIISNKFMEALKVNDDIPLIDYSINKIIKYVNARELFDKLIIVRSQTGEPLIFFEDNANIALAEHHKKLGLKIKTTNLCTEITLPTGIDHKGKVRTAVCCLSSINLAKRNEWLYDENFILDIAYFQDNVLTFFNIMSTRYHVGDIVKENVYYFIANNAHLEKEAIEYANKINHPLKNAIYSAYSSRDIGIGVVGLQTLFQQEGIAVESKGKLTKRAKEFNIEIFKDIYEKFNKCNVQLALERGSCPDIIDANVNYKKRFSYMLAIAPTTVISILMNVSPSIQFDPPEYVYKNQTFNTSVYNQLLKELLIKKGLNNIDVWRNINAGKYQGILTEEEYEIFKGGCEINQLNILEMAADRTPYIDQAQSINLSISRNITTVRPLREMLIYAYENKIKTLYYSFNQTTDTIDNNLKQSSCDVNSDTCDSCSS